MKETNRRVFLAATGSGVAAAAAVAVAPSALAAGPASTPSQSKQSGPVVAYVRDAAQGVVAVMVGEREYVVTDRDLVARITRHIPARQEG